MKLSQFFLSIFIIVSVIACGDISNKSLTHNNTRKINEFSFVQGEVFEILSENIIVKLGKIDIQENNSYIDLMANRIVNSSLLLIGMHTYINGQESSVVDIRGNQITFKAKDLNFKKGDSVKIYIPKKTIAIMDFSVVGIEDKSLEKYTMEGLTTKMVQSGQYIVVEREKLETILKEQKLALFGLLDKGEASIVGKLLTADIILTGSLTKIGDIWSINARLLDAITGVILAAINEETNIDTIRLTQSKTNSKIIGNFEEEQSDNGWILNIINKNKSQSNGSIDHNKGANNTQRSYKIDYFLKNSKSTAKFSNNKFRDFSNYKGIEFYAKSNTKTSLELILFDRNFSDSNKNKWISVVNVSENWKKYKVPFQSFRIGTKFAKKKPGGDSILDLDSIEKINLEIAGKYNSKNKKHSLWIDEIILYH